MSLTIVIAINRLEQIVEEAAILIGFIFLLNALLTLEYHIVRGKPISLHPNVIFEI